MGAGTAVADGAGAGAMAGAAVEAGIEAGVGAIWIDATGEAASDVSSDAGSLSPHETASNARLAINAPNTQKLRRDILSLIKGR